MNTPSMIRMTQTCMLLLAAILLTNPRPTVAAKPEDRGPARVSVLNGKLTLTGLLWRPRGAGPFPAILLNHGSGRTREQLERLGPYEQNAGVLGPLFARHGYVFLYLFRRGVGLSADQGTSAVDLMNNESEARGQDARNELQLQLLTTLDMSDATAGLTFLRALPEVDPRDVALVGHSFGGSLTVLMAERDSALRAAVVFSGAGYSWDRSPALRRRLLDAVDHASVPFFFIHTENDYATAAGEGLDAELGRLGKPHRLKVYPPVGKTPDEGHDFLHLGVSIWEPEVFAFLDEYMQKRGSSRSRQR
jgi:dienelactone hydrolase